MSEQGSVLVVDDDPVTRLMLTGSLERRGLQVTTAEDGAQARGIGSLGSEASPDFPEN